MVPPHSIAGKYTVSVVVFADGKVRQPGEEVKLSHEEAGRLLAAGVVAKVIEDIPEAAAAPPPTVHVTLPLSRIVKMMPRIDRREKTPAERALAGTYRVIHGSIVVPRPWEDWHNPDGTEKPHEPKTLRAGVTPSKFAIADDPKKGIAAGDPVAWLGDEIWLNDEDAANLLDLGVIEPIATTPSRAGTVFAPPKPNAA